MEMAFSLRPSEDAAGALSGPSSPGPASPAPASPRSPTKGKGWGHENSGQNSRTSRQTEGLHSPRKLKAPRLPTPLQAIPHVASGLHRDITHALFRTTSPRHSQSQTSEAARGRQPSRSSTPREEELQRNLWKYSFTDVEPGMAEAFVQRGSYLWKWCRTGWLSFTPKKTVHRFFVDTEAHVLQWDSHKQTKERESPTGGSMAGRIFLSDILSVRAYVLDGPGSGSSGRLSSEAIADALNNSHGLSAMFGSSSRVGLHFRNGEVDFEVVHRQQLQECRLRLRARNRTELKMWVTGLQHLVFFHQKLMSAGNLEAMSRMMFKKADIKGEGRLAFDDVRDLLYALGVAGKGRVHSQVERMFNSFDMDSDGTIGEDEFVSFFESLMVKKELQKYFEEYSEFVTVTDPQAQDTDDVTVEDLAMLSWPSTSELMPGPTQRFSGRRLMTPEMLCVFMKTVQGEVHCTEEDAEKMIEGLHKRAGSGRSVLARHKALTEIGFNLLICSETNMIIDPEKAKETQDMTLPLSRYWISASHNTYLEGKQIAGTASVAQYIEVLQRGCRCVEIDVWDGKDGDPVVTHAYLSKPWIKFRDVVRVCRDHAFEKTDYPLIISIEQHCSGEQKAECGRILNDTFGEMLLRLPNGDIEEAELVSPEEAKRKVIIKAKPTKISAALDDSTDSDPDISDVEDEDLTELLDTNTAANVEERLGPRTSTGSKGVMPVNSNDSTRTSRKKKEKAAKAAIAIEGQRSRGTATVAPPPPPPVPGAPTVAVTPPPAPPAHVGVGGPGRKSALRKSHSMRSEATVDACSSVSFLEGSTPLEQGSTGQIQSNSDRDLSKSGSVESMLEVPEQDNISKHSHRSSSPLVHTISGRSIAVLHRQMSKLRRSLSSLSSKSSTDARRPRRRRTEQQSRLISGLKEYNRCIYLQAKKFAAADVTGDRLRYPCNCSSFVGVRMQQWLQVLGPAMDVYHQDNLSRVYPGLKKTNVKPFDFWLHGVQLVALNYQNVDEAMLLNEGVFRHQNGAGGYVLKPALVMSSACLCSKGHRMAWTNKADDDWVCDGEGQDQEDAWITSTLSVKNIRSGSPRTEVASTSTNRSYCINNRRLSHQVDQNREAGGSQDDGEDEDEDETKDQGIRLHAPVEETQVRGRFSPTLRRKKSQSGIVMNMFDDTGEASVMFEDGKLKRVPLDNLQPAEMNARAKQITQKFSIGSRTQASAGRFRCLECNVSICEACAIRRCEVVRQWHTADPRRQGPMPLTRGGSTDDLMAPAFTLRIRIISAYFLPRPQIRQATLTRPSYHEEPASPYVTVRVYGVECDNAKCTTKVERHNGFDPVWDETFGFFISRPDVAILTLQVTDDNTKHLMAVAAYPVNLLRDGVRWAPMWDLKLRTLEHCGLLVEIRTEQPNPSPDAGAGGMSSPKAVARAATPAPGFASPRALSSRAPSSRATSMRSSRPPSTRGQSSVVHSSAQSATGSLALTSATSSLYQHGATVQEEDDLDDEGCPFPSTSGTMLDFLGSQDPEMLRCVPEASDSLSATQSITPGDGSVGSIWRQVSASRFKGSNSLEEGEVVLEEQMRSSASSGMLDMCRCEDVRFEDNLCACQPCERAQARVSPDDLRVTL